MPSSKAAALFTLALASFNGALAALNLDSPSNIAVYWGQNSYGQSTGPYVQQRLSHYCRTTDADVYQLSFVTRINGAGGVPEVNFANAGDNCTAFPGTQLLECPQIAEDIKECQSLGRTILLSIGGATYNEGGFSSEAAAIAGAKMIWETFGPVSNSSAKRPFGDAVVDGFDFDFEAVVNNMPAFGNQLRSYYGSDASKKYYTTAAPQCPYPDAADGPMLDGAVYFDAIWIQFYNNFCGLQSFVPGSSTQTNFNFDVWDKWARETSLNKNAKVFLGVPGNKGAAGTGYQPISTVTEIIQYVKKFSSFGGVMIWDASQVYANSGFLSGLRSALGGGSAPTATTSSTTTSNTASPTPTTQTTSTSTTLTTTTKSSTTSSTSGQPTATTTSTVCPVAGQTCPTNGAVSCNGSQFGICNNERWEMQQCPAGLVCAQGSSGVYCDFPGSAGVTPCS
ncbi:class III chitinase [Aspergillus bombycis]|uniref:chitinase n=1 Tax=Aspergillus bombycis TaxID=109264 RepID=A0A1F8A843_9EURO|nr:class III chitinase [Aspergillus bombycis]OGM47843.1 class III chitinase [Aspergillus bombycis]